MPEIEAVPKGVLFEDVRLTIENPGKKGWRRFQATAYLWREDESRFSSHDLAQVLGAMAQMVQDQAEGYG